MVQNVFTITGYSGTDPEVPNGMDNSFYPRLSWPEHVICNLGVVGSNPTRGSKKLEYESNLFLFYSLRRIYLSTKKCHRCCSGDICVHKISLV